MNPFPPLQTYSDDVFVTWIFSEEANPDDTIHHSRKPQERFSSR